MKKRLVKINDIWFDLETGYSNNRLNWLIKKIFGIGPFDKKRTIIDWYLPVNGLMLEKIGQEFINALYKVGNDAFRDRLFNTKTWCYDENDHEVSYYNNHIAFYLRSGDHGVSVFDADKKRIKIPEELHNLLVELYLNLVKMYLNEIDDQLEKYEKSFK